MEDIVKIQREVVGRVRVIYKIARRNLWKLWIRYKSCFPKKKCITSLYNKNILIINNKINLINKLEKMRTKEVILAKLERLETEIKQVGYFIRRAETDVAFDKVAMVLEHIGDIRTILNTEHQD